MFRYVAVLLYAVSAVALGSSDDFDKVNGSIEVEAGRRVGDVSTVNGAITVGSGASVQDVETVNGRIRIDARATAQSVETVNGSITVAEGVVISGNVEAVNGDLALGRGARVDGRLENVNGDFRLDGAIVGSGIRTVNGDVRVGTGSRVDGGILVEKTSGWSWGGKASRPSVTIESGATVNGPLRFEREVELYVGAGAVVGPVEGVQPERHALP
jgi:DUF4097 and DUF4098 domain-containing protein YvlB